MHDAEVQTITNLIYYCKANLISSKLLKSQLVSSNLICWQLEWARTHDAEAQTMSRNGRLFAREHLIAEQVCVCVCACVCVCVCVCVYVCVCVCVCV